MKNNSENIVEFVKHYNKHKTALYNFCLKMLGDEEKVMDIVQNSFLKLFENLGKIRNKDKIPAWLFTTARNEIYALYRERKKPLNYLDGEELYAKNIPGNDNPATELENTEMKNIILEELSSFSSINRETFLLRKFGELSYREIADVMNTEVNIVKSRLFKTRKKLLDKISKLI